MKRSKSFGDFDMQTLREAFSGPGMDPREWVSYAIVDADGESDEEKSVVFDEDMGPLVNVTLQPAGKQVRCRVASFVAGNGEADWYPFLEKDEVLVVMPEGSERNAIIIARLNQSIDKFPTMVGGADVTKNNVGFRRVRAPYIFEFAAPSSYLIKQIPTEACFLIDKSGAIYLKDGNKTIFHMGPDWVGFVGNEGAFQIQYVLEDDKFLIKGKDAAVVVDLNGDGTASTFMVPGVLSIGTAGGWPFFHATTVEAICNLINQAMVAWATVLAATGVTPLTGVSLAATMVDPSGIPPAFLPLTGAIPAAAATPLPPAQLGLIQTGLQRPPSPTDGITGMPGLGAVGLLV